MSRQSVQRRRRAAVANWFRWLPVLVVPFLVLFFETWLHTRIIQHDYESHTLHLELRRLRESMTQLRAQEASLRRHDRLDSQAPDLGLVEPEPDQIVVMRVSAAALETTDSL